MPVGQFDHLEARTRFVADVYTFAISFRLNEYAKWMSIVHYNVLRKDGIQLDMCFSIYQTARPVILEQVLRCFGTGKRNAITI